MGGREEEGKGRSEGEWSERGREEVREEVRESGVREGGRK